MEFVLSDPNEFEPPFSVPISEPQELNGVSTSAVDERREELFEMLADLIIGFTGDPEAVDCVNTWTMEKLLDEIEVTLYNFGFVTYRPRLCENSLGNIVVANNLDEDEAAQWS